MKSSKLAEKLEYLIDQEVQKTVDTNSTWKEKYEWLVSEIQNEQIRAQDLFSDMKENGLTAGTIEAEGYLRCAITIENIVTRIEEAYK